MSLSSQDRLNHYEIRSRLDLDGHHGETYLALDLELDRFVALQLISPVVVADRPRLQEAITETRLLSKLNHPNILSIFDLDQTGSLHFIVTENIDGLTLRRYLRRRSLQLEDAMEIIVQVAAALEAAHEIGVVHQNVRPENIIIRKDGYVKVMNFGAAGGNGDGSPMIARDPGATRPKLLPATNTVNYLAPEQIRGLEIDRRADVWGLGVLLYEMVMGQSPFAAATPSETLANILEREPQPPVASRIADEVIAAKLGWIMAKALRKDRDERYQTMREILADLKWLRQQLGVRAAGLQLLHSEEMRNSLTGSGEFFAGGRRGRRAILLAAALIALLLTAAVGYRYWHTSEQRRADRLERLSFQSAQLSRLTNNGRAVGAVISPDGKYVVYALEEAGRQSLWVRQVATKSTIEIVQPAEGLYLGLTLAPDGNYLYHVRVNRRDPTPTLYQVPALGGASVRIAGNVRSPVTFSPDGKRIAFIRNYENENAIIVANADGSAERVLASRKLSEGFSDGGPAWSPDGRRIACAAGRFTEKRVLEISVENGSETPLGSEVWYDVGRMAWLPGGTGLLMTARDRSTRLSQLWKLSYPEGEARRITNDLSNYTDVSVSAHTLNLISVQSDQTSNIWVTPEGANTAPPDENGAQQVTAGKSDGEEGLAWSPAGESLVYQSKAQSTVQLWSLRGGAGEPRQLTDGPYVNVRPSFSPDGREIIFVSGRTGRRNIWRMNPEGGEQRQVTSGDGETWPVFSPDGKWILYVAFGSGRHSLWRVPAAGDGAPRQLIENFSTFPALSPDGRWIAGFYRDELNKQPLKIAVFPFEGGPPVKLFDPPLSLALIGPSNLVKWTPDSRALVYIDDRGGASNLWSQPLDGGKPAPLTSFKGGQLFWFDLSRDGKRYALARGSVIRDVVLVSQAK